jgi:hypothetical protein
LARTQHPTTGADVHVLVSAGHLPAVDATASIIQGAESVFGRLEVDDMPKGDARHRVGISLSGPRAIVLQVLDQLRAAVIAAQPPEGGEGQ